MVNHALCPAFLSLLPLRESLIIHFGEQANLFNCERGQEKTALASAKADFPSLSEYKNLLLAAQKQLLEVPLMDKRKCKGHIDCNAYRVVRRGNQWTRTDCRIDADSLEQKGQK